MSSGSPMWYNNRSKFSSLRAYYAVWRLIFAIISITYSSEFMAYIAIPLKGQIETISDFTREVGSKRTIPLVQDSAWWHDFFLSEAQSAHPSSEIFSLIGKQL